MMTTKPLYKAIAWAQLSLATFAALVPTFAGAGENTVVFSGETRPPWQLFLGSESNWSVPVWGDETTAHKSEVIVVRQLEEGENRIVQAEWNGGVGQMYWQQPSPTDLTHLLEDGFALSVVARIDEKPKKSVDLKMDCGYPCGGALNVTKLFKAVPEGQWFRMTFELGCFKEAGANMKNIYSPLVIMTRDTFEISISEVSLTQDAPAESMVACG